MDWYSIKNYDFFKMIWRKIHIKIFIFLLGCIISMNSLAQNKTKVICPDDLLYKSFLYAKNDNYTKAKDVLYSIIKTYPNCAEAYSRLMELSYRTNDTFYTLQYAKRLLELNPNKGITTILALSEVMKEYNDHALYVQLMELIVQENKVATESRAQIAKTIETNKVKQKLLSNFTTDEPVKMDSNINANTTQCFPSLTLNGKKLFFTRIVNEMNEDFYVSDKMDTCVGWSKAVALGTPPNTSGPDGAAHISADGNYLFFTKCDQRSDNGYDGGGCDIFFCYQTAEGWSSPEKFKSTINSMHYEGQPCLNSLNTELYFVSDRKGGYGGKDIYKSKFVKGLWQEPINLGSQINSAADDESPFIHPDNNTLYFVSRGHETIGGQDIFKSKKISDTMWDNSVNLGSPINSEANENSICVQANGVDALIGSNRNNAKNQYSIYSIVLPMFARANAIQCVTGIVYDKYSNEIIPNIHMEVMDSNDNVIQKIRSNSGDASFTFPLKPGNKYYYTIADVTDYRNFRQELDLTSTKNKEALIQADAYLKSIDFVDTLFSSRFFGSENYDTTLFHLTHDVINWHTQTVDSLVLYCTLTVNKNIDTSWLLNVCVTDSLKEMYVQAQADSQKKQEFQVLEYFDFFKKYISQKKIPIKEMVISINSEIWQTKERYRLNCDVVEYY
jgi:hypothetical protein